MKRFIITAIVKGKLHSATTFQLNISAAITKFCVEYDVLEENIISAFLHK